jgi:hypothetical protein
MPVQTRSQTMMLSKLKCNSMQAQALLKKMDNIKTINCVNTDLYYSKLSLMNQVIDDITIYCENLISGKRTHLFKIILNKIAELCRHIESPTYAPVTQQHKDLILATQILNANIKRKHYNHMIKHSRP